MKKIVLFSIMGAAVISVLIMGCNFPSREKGSEPKPGKSQPSSKEKQQLESLGYIKQPARQPEQIPDRTSAKDGIQARRGSASPTPPPSTGGTQVVNNKPYDAVFYESAGTNPFVDTEDDHLSTFAVDVDTASFTMARRYIMDGNIPDKDAVRVEEFVNYFHYDYPKPSSEYKLSLTDSAPDPFSINLEAGPSRFGGERHKLLRVGLQGREVEEKNRKDAVLTFVIDVSGSMEQEGRLELVKQSLAILVDKLRERDKVAMVVYGTEGRVLMKHRGLGDKEKILDAIGQLIPEGSTNAAEGLSLGYKEAAEAFKKGAINRVILCSDGVANQGETGAEQILKSIQENSDQGITLTTVGFGMGNYNDVLMEKLADKGDGAYYYVDDLDEAKRVFIENLTGTLQVIARDVKVQVDFNPQVVASYRLLGYENRDVADQDFRNDKVDAGEIGAGHQVTALYEIKLAREANEGRVATVTVRYKDAERESKVKEMSGGIDLTGVRDSFAATTGDFQLAAVAAEYAEVLRKSYWARDGNLDAVQAALQDVPADVRRRPEVIDLMSLISKTQKLEKSRQEQEQKEQASAP